MALARASAGTDRCRRLRLVAISLLIGMGLGACSTVAPKPQLAELQRAAPIQPVDGLAPQAENAVLEPEAAGAESSQSMASAAPRTARKGKSLSGSRYKVGAPYRVAGKLYVPAQNADYDEVGIASWYGPQFNGRSTANGERFNMFVASAAHTTLPLPSIVEVTNLDNGRSIRVRINDRGPFKPGRIIDLSRGAAQELGYLQKGLARVRVRYVGPAGLDDTLAPSLVAQARPGPSENIRLASLTTRGRRSTSGRPIWTAEASERLDLILEGNEGPVRRISVAVNADDRLPPLW